MQVRRISWQHQQNIYTPQFSSNWAHFPQITLLHQNVCAMSSLSSYWMYRPAESVANPIYIVQHTCVGTYTAPISGNSMIAIIFMASNVNIVFWRIYIKPIIMHAPATGLFSDTCMISPVCHTCAKLFLAVDRCICHFVIFLSTQVNLFQISRPIHIILKSNEMFVNNTFRPLDQKQNTVMTKENSSSNTLKSRDSHLTWHGSPCA